LYLLIFLHLFCNYFTKLLAIKLTITDSPKTASITVIGSHKGESTHIQDQSIRFVSFNTRKIKNIGVVSPIEVDVFVLILFVLIFISIYVVNIRKVFCYS
jgi:hypothetical protein